MRLVRGDTDVLLSLSTGETAQLMDACAMVVLAAEAVPSATLHPEMASLLRQLFQALGDTSADLRA